MSGKGGKANLKSVKILSINKGHTNYGGEMMFEFKDGSRFVVRNKTVVKSSRLGTLFHQFPTTFHDVVLPDGSKFQSPSERNMAEVFTTY